MPRTLKTKWCRSYAYKRNKQQRGWQRLYDMESHNMHRNMNINSDEITYTKFDCKLKSGNNGINVYTGDKRYLIYNPASLQYALEDYDWKKESMVQFLQRKISQYEGTGGRNGTRDWKMYVDALKQINRRGENARFITHGRRYKKLDQTY